MSATLATAATTLAASGDAHSVLIPILLAIPLLGSFIVFSMRPSQALEAKFVALIVSLIVLAYTAILGFNFDTGKGADRFQYNGSWTWIKGFGVYREVDEMIASGRLPQTELWVIGRWPKEIQWKSAHTEPPCSGPALGSLLRNCHVYLTAPATSGSIGIATPAALITR